MNINYSHLAIIAGDPPRSLALGALQYLLSVRNNTIVRTIKTMLGNVKVSHKEIPWPSET